VSLNSLTRRFEPPMGFRVQLCSAPLFTRRLESLGYRESTRRHSYRSTLACAGRDGFRCHLTASSCSARELGDLEPPLSLALTSRLPLAIFGRWLAGPKSLNQKFVVKAKNASPAPRSSGLNAAVNSPQIPRSARLVVLCRESESRPNLLWGLLWFLQ
jgi:hypothetical protein